jgi:glyoxylase-like metal-dependent hydrolase (beta-lactamase superfamily II)
MMQRFEFFEVVKDIYRLCVPFESLYTSVFLIRTERGDVLVDCATTQRDVDECIVPALKALGLSLTDLCYVVVTHDHGDHAGGLERILSLSPDIEVIREARELFCGVSTYALPGHTDNMIGVLDVRTLTLISGDGLQGAGIDKYRTSVPLVSAYKSTIDKIRRDERIENVLFSHAYEPWYKDAVFGRETVLLSLDQCLEYVK